MRLNDKVAIITGAASGIGKDIAIVFAREGAKVAIADLNQKAADATAREIDPGGKRAIGVAMDVTDEQQVEAGTVRVIEAFGALDILVSNAGIQIVAPLVEYYLTDVHLEGPWTGPAQLTLVSHALAPLAELPVLEVVAGTHIIADLTLDLGKVVHDYLA